MQFCFNVDVAALNVPGVGNGSIATIQFVVALPRALPRSLTQISLHRVEFNGGDGMLFQCSDVILSSTFQPTNVSCVNSTAASTTTSSATGTTGSAAAATSKSAAKSLKATVAGAVVALGGAVALVL